MVVFFCVYLFNRNLPPNFRSQKHGLQKRLPWRRHGITTIKLDTVAKATNEFSSSNKLEEGGFGPLYKGTLIGGKEIAVKRPSKDSGQGLREFKNEVMLISGLQHRNLVKLLGCCIQEDENILIYEYMNNRSRTSLQYNQV
ncbi:S-locus lectin protein kinase family protein [Prunus dulcis]|uniref:non-specific serine/threonine protein kinase n=1 Tax=Prunus dulcis TaxID=3755 RepID=A0A4Y1QYJ3_PRUDU|nr:S-locus lectin protein kinase family protein [Prunus dulcis]